MAKFLDTNGVGILYQLLNMQDYPNNETLITIINAIDETKQNKEDESLNTSSKNIVGAINELLNQDVFIATYGTTTLEEISEALNLGKICFCIYWRDMYPNVATMTHFSQGVFASFAMIYSGISKIRQFNINANGWSYTDKNIPNTYTLPVATSSTLGGVKPVTKTDAMTQEVGIDENGLLYTLPSGESSGAVISSIEPAEDDIPTLYIDGTIPTTKTAVNAQLRYVSKTLDFSCFLEIKCQGTSSLAYPKKNFTIKMFEDEAHETKLKKNFKGWGSQNKFCLKANWMDLSHARNIVSARLWADCVKTRSDFDTLPEEYRTSPNLGAVDGFPIRLFCNGLYWGRYTLNIPKDGWMSNMDDELETHCILCSEDYNSGCFQAEALIDKTDWTDELHDTVPASILTRWNEVINFIRTSTDEDFVANIGNYFNLPSLIDYYCFSYGICHLDGLGKNQLFFTYDGNVWIAGAYDMDSTWGLYWDGSSFVSTSYRMQEDYETAVNGTSNLLYERLANLFADMIKARWTELRNGPLSNYNVINRFKEFCEITSAELISKDYSTYTGNGQFTTIPLPYDNNLEQILWYGITRLKWVDAKLNPTTASGETLLRENYAPGGESWVDTVTMDFSNGDYIEVSMDLSTCSPDGVGLENVLSIGNSISAWLQTGYHLYYSASTQSLEINCMFSDNSSQRSTLTLIDTTAIVRIDSTGIYVNDEYVFANKEITSLYNVEIGSAEGSVRSNATYNYIKVVIN